VNAFAFSAFISGSNIFAFPQVLSPKS